MDNTGDLKKLLKYSKKQTKFLVLFGFLILLALIVILIISARIFANISPPHSKQTSDEEYDDVCTSKECIETAYRILENMDSTADPCDDFYKFSCGGYEKNQRIPDESSGSISVLENLQAKLLQKIPDLLSEKINLKDIKSTINAKNLYNSCVDEEKIEAGNASEIKSFLKNEFNGWPILEGSKWNATLLKDKSFLFNLLIKARLLDANPFFAISLMDVSHDYITSTQPFLVLEMTDKITYMHLNGTSIEHSYKAYMTNVVEALNSRLSRDEIRKEINEIYAFEEKLEKIKAVNGTEKLKARNSTLISRTDLKSFILHHVRRRQVDIKNVTKKVDLTEVLNVENKTLGSLHNVIPNFNWTEFILDETFGRHSKLTLNTSVLIADLEYLIETVKLFNEYSREKPKVLINFILWKIVQASIDALPLRFRLEKYQFERFYNHTFRIVQRRVKCSLLVNEKMKFATGRLFINKYLENETRDALTDLALHIKESFIKNFNSIKWLDNLTFEIIQQKLHSIGSIIGFKDVIMDDAILNGYYREFEFSNSSFFENLAKLGRITAIRDIKNLENTNVSNEITSDLNLSPGPITMNAFFDPSRYEIELPAGIIQPPLFDLAYPNYLNFARVGAIISHEIAHSFDYDTIKFILGTLNPGWTNKSKGEILKRTECLVKQYNRYFMREYNRYADGNSTVSEDIADNVGIKNVYHAYKEWIKKDQIVQSLPGLDSYTPDQLFFINYAQLWCNKWNEKSTKASYVQAPHSPGELRTLGPLSNLEGFSKTFQCKIGSKYNPSEKCTFW